MLKVPTWNQSFVTTTYSKEDGKEVMRVIASKRMTVSLEGRTERQ
jgi:hypothetical protein